MIVILVFLLVIFGIAGWWLSHQRLMVKPWLEQGMVGDFIAFDRSALPTAKIGLGVFLAVVGCLFALFTSAYFMRMALSDWHALPVPRLLWLNTGVLVLSSIALQCASVAARKGQTGYRQAWPCHRRTDRARIPDWPAHGMAGTRRRRLFSGFQSGQQFFLPDHRNAWPAHTWGPGSSEQDNRRRMERNTSGTASPQRRIVRHVLAFPALHLARHLRCSGRLGRDFHRDLPTDC